MNGTPDFRKHALVFILLYLASRGLFAAASAFDGMSGCGCLAMWSRVFAWPAFVVGLGGLYVTATRPAMRANCFESPLGVVLLLLVPTACVGWATVCSAHGWGGDMAEIAKWTSFVAFGLAGATSLALIHDIRRDRRNGGLPVAEVLK